jgi:hypothetical protein
MNATLTWRSSWLETLWGLLASIKLPERLRPVALLATPSHRYDLDS